MASAIDDSYELVAEFTEDCQYLHITHWQMYKKALKKFVGEDVLITVRKLKSKRSDKQNRYMWAVIVPMVRHWLYQTQGEKYSPEHVYVWIRVKLLEEEPTVVEVAGSEIITMTGKKFSAMNTAEFSSAVDKIRDEMLQRGLDIPEPTHDKNKHNLLSEFLNDN